MAIENYVSNYSGLRSSIVLTLSISAFLVWFRCTHTIESNYLELLVLVRKIYEGHFLYAASIGYGRFVWNLSKLNSRHINVYCKKLTQV